MTNTNKATNKARIHYLQSIRQLHRFLSPIILLPLFLTTITGIAYQIMDLAGKEKAFKWLLDLHKGDFGVINLEIIYPFLTSLGLLTLMFTGISMWLNTRRTAKKHNQEID